MLPTVVLLKAEVDLNERPPLRALRFADQMHARFRRRLMPLARVALDTRADNVLPRGRPAPISRNDVVQVQVVPVKDAPAVLAGVLVALKNVVSRELHLLLGQAIVEDQKDHARHTDSKRNGMDAFRMWLLLREVVPFVEIERLERAVVVAQNRVSVALEQQCQRTARGADIHRLPEAIQHQYMLVEVRTHGCVRLGAQANTRFRRVSTP